jgi:hypothetical protein
MTIESQSSVEIEINAEIKAHCLEFVLKGLNHIFASEHSELPALLLRLAEIIHIGISDDNPEKQELNNSMLYAQIDVVNNLLLIHPESLEVIKKDARVSDLINETLEELQRYTLQRAAECIGLGPSEGGVIVGMGFGSFDMDSSD